MIIRIYVNFFPVDKKINNKNTIKSNRSKYSKYRKYRIEIFRRYVDRGFMIFYNLQ